MPSSRIWVAVLLFCPPEVKPNQAAYEKQMKNLIEILQKEKSSIKLEVSGEDLLEFSNDLINHAKNELSAEIAEANKERYLTKDEVREICGVCDATLWHWNKKGYLKVIKVGNKVRYRMSDVRQILEGGEKKGGRHGR